VRSICAAICSKQRFLRQMKRPTPSYQSWRGHGPIRCVMVFVDAV
jgi:hypothetical protein